MNIADGEELECRVCRNGSDISNPLYHPCKCSGSIGVVHQECLEQWLKHSKKDTCELCFTKYQFEPQYAPNAPDVIPIHVLIKSIFKTFIYKFIPYVSRLITALIVWLGFVPIGTTCVYCVCIGRNNLITSDFSWYLVLSHIKIGLVLDAVIALSLLILVSFTDFLRFHWIPGPENNNQPDVAAGDIAAVPIVPNVPIVPPMQHEQFPLVANIEQQPLIPTTIEDNEAAPHIVPPSNTNNPLVFINNNNEEVFDENLELNISPYTDRFYRRTDNPVYQQGNIGNYNTITNTINGIHSNIDMHDLNTNDIDMHDLNTNTDRNEDHYDFNWNEIENRDMIDNNANNNCNNLDYINNGITGNDNNHESFDIDNNNNQNENIINDNNIPVNNDIRANEPQAQQQQQEEENVQEEEEVEGDNVQENGIEIRVALFDLLGIEGPIYIMFRNSFWLLGFCSLYLFSLAALPYIIGYKVVHVFKIHVLMKYITIFPVFRFLSDVYEVATKNKIPLQFIDFIYMGTGMSAVFLIVFLLNLIAKASLSFKLIEASVLSNYFELVKKLSVVVKVGLLLVIRIFVLPLVLGSVLLSIVADYLLPYTWEEWVYIFASNCVGSFSLAWVAGITFMLTMTISVLQIREVLHPDFLAKIIRPQEPHVELISSLVHESGLLHIRRIIVSCLVYMLLMTLFLFVPIISLYYISIFFQIDPTFHLKFWYVIPEVQVPLELLIVHITFLSILDKRKDMIGKLQHKFLVKLAGYMGVTRYLVPVRLIQLRINVTGGNRNTSTTSESPSKHPDNTPQQHSQQHQQEQRNEIVDHMNEIVEKPLLRPPAGWDVRAPNQSTRWAWGTEEPSFVEKNVAPRIIPKNWLFILILILSTTWLLVNSFVLFIFIIPLTIGRSLLYYIMFPTILSHDPLSFVVGLVVIQTITSVLIIFTKNVSLQLKRILHWSNVVKLNMILRAMKVLLLLGFIQISIGFTCLLQLHSEDISLAYKDIELFNISTWIITFLLQIPKAFCYGFVIMNFFMYLISIDRIHHLNMNILHLDAKLIEFMILLRRMYTNIKISIFTGKFTNDTFHYLLLEFEQIIMNCYVPIFVTNGLLSVILIGYALTCSIEAKFNTTISTLLDNLYISNSCYLIIRLIQILNYSIYYWLKQCYEKIRNDNYLIGRKLVNNVSF